MSYGYLMGVPGRKAWDLHSHENISSQEYVKSLIRIYQEYPALNDRILSVKIRDENF